MVLDLQWPDAFDDARGLFSGIMIESLIRKGSCLIQLPKREEKSRLPSRRFWNAPSPVFAEAFLGSDSDSSILWLEDSEAYGLRQIVDDVCKLLHSVAWTSFGFEAAPEARWLMLRQGSESSRNVEAAERIPDNTDVTTLLEFASQRRICLMQVLSSADTGTITLTPRRNDLGMKVVEVPVKADTLFIFRHDLMSYSCKLDSSDCILQAWLVEKSAMIYTSSFQIEGEESEVLAVHGAPPGAHLAKNGDAHIMGLGGYLPATTSPAQAFSAYSRGTDFVVDIPVNRWDHSVYYSENVEDGLAVNRHVGFIEDSIVHAFDPRFFSMDDEYVRNLPRQVPKTCEAAYATLYDAGFTMETIRGAPLYVSVAQLNMIGDNVSWDISSGLREGFNAKERYEYKDVEHWGKSMLTCNYVSMAFNTTGPQFVLDTACSAALVLTGDLHQRLAMARDGPQHGLLSTESTVSMGLVLGCRLLFTGLNLIGGSQAHMIGSMGRCMTYNESANGFTCSEAQPGIFMCHMDSIEAAREQYGAVVGSAINQDGRSASLTAPNGPSQTKCYSLSMQQTGRTPHEATSTEAHGTGTKLGDSIEYGSLKNFFNKAERVRPLGIATFKTYTGHPEQSAGIMAIIKQLHNMKFGVQVSNLHLREMNPNIDMANYPALIESEVMDVQVSTAFVGCTGMGFGGTNARVDLIGVCHFGHRQIPEVARLPTSKRIVSAPAGRHQQRKPIDTDSIDLILTSCPKCSGEMCMRCKEAAMPEWSRTGHICHLVREEGAAYDCCSACYKGDYLMGKAPPVDAGDPEKALQMVSEWMGASTTRTMEQVTDTLGDICYVQRFSSNSAGTLRFHFALEEDPSLEVYPVVDDADQSVRVIGPDWGRSGKSWKIEMPASTRYRIQFKWDYSGRKLEWQAEEDEDRQPRLAEAMSNVSAPPANSAYSLMCSSLGWCMMDMVYNEDDEAFEAMAEIGPTGEDLFFFASNQDLAQSIFPALPKTWDTSVSIAGPASNTAGNTWVLRGLPGEVCKITLRLSELPFSTMLYVTTACETYGERIWESAWNETKD